MSYGMIDRFSWFADNCIGLQRPVFDIDGQFATNNASVPFQGLSILIRIRGSDQ